MEGKRANQRILLLMIHPLFSYGAPFIIHTFRTTYYYITYLTHLELDTIIIYSNILDIYVYNTEYSGKYRLVITSIPTLKKRLEHLKQWFKY